MVGKICSKIPLLVGKTWNVCTLSDDLRQSLKKTYFLAPKSKTEPLPVLSIPVIQKIVCPPSIYQDIHAVKLLQLVQCKFAHFLHSLLGKSVQAHKASVFLLPPSQKVKNLSSPVVDTQPKVTKDWRLYNCELSTQMPRTCSVGNSPWPLIAFQWVYEITDRHIMIVFNFYLISKHSL